MNFIIKKAHYHFPEVFKMQKQSALNVKHKHLQQKLLKASCIKDTHHPVPVSPFPLWYTWVDLPCELKTILQFSLWNNWTDNKARENIFNIKTLKQWLTLYKIKFWHASATQRKNILKHQQVTANSNNEAEKWISTSPLQSTISFSDDISTPELTPHKINLKWRTIVTPLF